MHYRYLFIFLLLLSSCEKESTNTNTEVSQDKLFSLVRANESNVNFNNKVVETNAFNFLNYPYIYIGGGVAVGDINNDGLADIYFTANQGTDKLYLNQDNLNFKDITVTANLTDNNGWSSGVSMIDINNDGWLDKIGRASCRERV